MKLENDSRDEHYKLTNVCERIHLTLLRYEHISDIHHQYSLLGLLLPYVIYLDFVHSTYLPHWLRRNPFISSIIFVFNFVL